MSHSRIALPVELMEEIFQNLAELSDDDDEEEEVDVKVLEENPRRDLLSCALSCSLFLRPALKVLWHTVELMPLLELLPLDALNDEFNEDSLQRFDFYSSMVKMLFIPETVKVNDTVYTWLAILRPRPLPLLTSVYCRVLSSTPETMFMLSPCLKSVIFTRCSTQVLMEYLALVKKEAPLLRSLTAFNTFHGEFKLAALSQLRNLYALHLNLRLLNDMEQVPSQPIGLGRLHLCRAGPLAQKALTLLHMYKDSKVESFSLTRCDFQAEACTKILDAISSQWSGSLLNLKLAFPVWGLYEFGTEDPLPDLLSPLYSLGNIQVLNLQFRGDKTYFTDTLISNFCNAWPGLTNLAILGYNFNKLPTVASLETLSERCPRLKQVTIPLDIGGAPVINDDDHKHKSFLSTSSHQLESITLVVEEKATLKDFLASGSTSISYHLDNLFPCLKNVRLSQAGLPRVWDKVMDVIKLRQENRRQQGMPV